MGDTRGVVDVGKGPDGGLWCWAHVKDQQAIGDSNVGAIVEGGWASTGNDLSGTGAQDRARVEEPSTKEHAKAESQNRAGVDGPTAEGRSAGSWARRGRR